tara:strand:+ start:1689 stop:2282 length:594 start_codon:yes stop_codon:yes gene_type:complete
MDPIEAQIQAQLDEIRSRGIDYTPSFEQNVQSQGIAPLVDTSMQNNLMDTSMQNNFVAGPSEIDPKEIAGNILKQQGIKFVARKLGMDKLQQNIFGSMLGVSTPFAPLATVSALTGVSSGIANLLRNKRTKKAIERDINRDSQGTINTIVSPRIMNMQPTARDIARGSMPTKSQVSKKSTPTANPYSGGPGGVQSGL